jgi:hypothetical protein
VGFNVCPSDSSSIPAATGGGAESRPVLRYSKEQRPTTLPIQPFVFQHHFPKQLAKARALHSLSQLYSLSGCSRAHQPALPAAPTAQGQAPVPSGEPQASTPQTTGRSSRKAGPEPETSRPSPLGSYSPIRSAGAFGPSTDSSASTSCSPPPEQATATENLPPWSHSCPPTIPPATSQQPPKEDQKILTLAEYRLHGTGSLPPLGSWRSGFSRAESLARGGGEGSMASRPNNGMSFIPSPSNSLFFEQFLILYLGLQVKMIHLLPQHLYLPNPPNLSDLHGHWIDMNYCLLTLACLFLLICSASSQPPIPSSPQVAGIQEEKPTRATWFVREPRPEATGSSTGPQKPHF